MRRHHSEKKTIILIPIEKFHPHSETRIIIACVPFLPTSIYSQSYSHKFHPFLEHNHWGKPRSVQQSRREASAITATRQLRNRQFEKSFTVVGINVCPANAAECTNAGSSCIATNERRSGRTAAITDLSDNVEIDGSQWTENANASGTPT